MAKILRGADALEAKCAELKDKVRRLRNEGTDPVLAIIRVGEDPDNMAYERGLVKRAEELGIMVEKYVMDEKATETTVIALIRRLNYDDDIHGVLLMRPLPEHMDDNKVRMTLDPAKDLDGITDVSIAGVFAGTDRGFPPCTPSGCIELLEHYGIRIAGKKAVVIGRSMVTGRPLSMMLMRKNATVTLCHSHTSPEDLIRYCHNADLIFVMVGKPKTIKTEHVRPGQVIVDIGINVDKNGKLCGDTDFDNLLPIVKAITPVPGGVGAMTSVMLLEHLITAAVRSRKGLS
ncbi:MAG: bifunctional 5,10-methylenetetrahydrofolate dehydrogenase/5,10-methenyltetrahydrofolate cyclohydrolase [Firmicutes bacterium]|nr:bifunctional 5,10-methylenetetrahydrofolate dehydrogenase/5,10-methenyltetrahydrofolate cyclohydrolase [Bacillota bacterium]MBQ2677968.1 bifunctional 5,10-methylenetetrahydrofolate dehydrogenase/5,10-methenyltetrahydrofolate cyclohydrolase [Bacillota bacterium]MBR2511430.1 bifunctional 5,10-methylenetetrahydrofolate dehydrogenase/5,10-methenyltetrahydrofolate cyclohydrolase [Bacillota bacterium]MDO4860708.1 bifunctional 5,10-methylenetetrahydrofolate dehydrogenase/5,10-methenyltetrahydrofolat